MRWVLSLDTRAVVFLNGLGSPLVDPIFVGATILGGNLGTLIALVVYALRPGLRPKLRTLVVGTGLAALAVWLVRLGVQRPRPCNVLALRRVVEPILSANSFPSGHAAFAGLLVTCALMERWRFRGLWIGFALVSALSRLYLGQHYPSDVLVGFALGAIAALLARLLVRLWRAPAPTSAPRLST